MKTPEAAVRTPMRARRRNRLQLYALLGIAAVCATSIADAAPPASPTYRIIQLSASAFVPAINARGQVSFTENSDSGNRAKLYNGHGVRDLGTLGGPTAEALAINNAGQVTGSASVNADGSIFHAYRWSPASGMLDLSRPGQGNSTGVAINNKGQVAGDAEFHPATMYRHAFFWSPHTGMLDVGTFDPNEPSDATALNDAGTVVGFTPKLNPGGPGSFALLAFRWTRSEGIRPIGTLPSEFTYALDINAAGHIVGSSPFPGGVPPHAFLWTPQAGLRDLGTGIGGPRSAASRINDQDIVVGNSGEPVSTAPSHGFIWTRHLGYLEIGSQDVNTSAIDVNNRGQVVGDIDNRAYVWSRSQGFIDLNTRIANAPAGLKLLRGVAISDNGSIVAEANTGLVLLVPRCGCKDAPPVVAPIDMTGSAHIGAPLSFNTAFNDADTGDSHTAKWSWGDGGTDAGGVSEQRGTGTVSSQHTYREPGIYTASLTVTDRNGKSTTVQRKVLVRGAGAYVTGDGWFMSSPGATKRTSKRTGIASFALLAPAATGAAATDAAAPQSKGNFAFSAGGIHLRNAHIDVLSVAAGQVRFSGSEHVSGTAARQFSGTLLQGTGNGKERIALRIWHHAPGSNAEVVDYDNQAAGVSAGATVEDGKLEVRSE
jgi:probable HAF family extracellular repeat protein